jgi:hypothetical protein
MNPHIHFGSLLSWHAPLPILVLAATLAPMVVTIAIEGYRTLTSRLRLGRTDSRRGGRTSTHARHIVRVKSEAN